MSAETEFKSLLRRAGMIPYRKVGRVRLAYTPGTPNETIEKAVAATKVLAKRLAEGWDEPSRESTAQWGAAGLTPIEVCDDPCPPEVDPRQCNARWLVDRCRRYHFRLRPDGNGGLKFVPEDGFTMADIAKLLPEWFVTACKERRPELIAVVSGEAG